MNSYFLSAHFNKYHSFPIISEVFLRISKVILLLLKEISCDTPWKEWGRHGSSHHISLKVPERRETHEKGMGKNGKEKGQELNGKKMELNGGKWERQWRIFEFALFEKNEDIKQGVVETSFQSLGTITFINEETKYIPLTNIIYFTNLNQTLPLGMHNGSRVLIDLLNKSPKVQAK